MEHPWEQWRCQRWSADHLIIVLGHLVISFIYRVSFLLAILIDQTMNLDQEVIINTLIENDPSLIIIITSPSVSVASRPLFVRVRHYATQLTAASRPYPPRKITHN